MTGSLNDDEQERFRAGRGFVNQIFTQKHRVYVGFIDLEKVYDRINREALWHVLRMYDVGK